MVSCAAIAAAAAIAAVGPVARPRGCSPGTPGPVLGADPATAAPPEQTGCQSDHHLQVPLVVAQKQFLPQTRTPGPGNA